MTETEYLAQCKKTLQASDDRGIFDDAACIAEGIPPMDLDAVAYQVALQFIGELRATLTAQQLADAIRRNAGEADPMICHTHDFCDANECMIAAFEQLGLEILPEDETEKEHALHLSGRAWDKAKAAEFDTLKLK